MDKIYASILEGIALEEAGISHILNAEGEKIQLAVAKCSSVCELLEINASVSCTLEDIMWLEFISYHKIKNLLCGCGFPKCCEPCDKKPENPCNKPCRENWSGEMPRAKPQGSVCQDEVCICGKVYKACGETANCGVVTARGKVACKTEISPCGEYELKNICPADKIIVSAQSGSSKSGSLLLKKPFKNSYCIDIFLE